MSCLLSPGKAVGDYIVDAFIGSGAYGEVYKVRDGLGKSFALKLLYQENTGVRTREIEGLTALRSSIRVEEGLPLIYHVGEYEGHVYYTMDLADNASRLPGVYKPDTLESRLQEQGRLSGLECIRLIRGLLVSLDALHRHGLVHRDIKPGNIIFCNRTPMLADIGLVTATPHTLVGTSGFLPPCPPGGLTLESEKSGDIYSLGKVLYCAFTGESAERYPLLPLKYSLSDFKVVRPLYLKACATDVAKRFADCGEFLKAVDQAEAKLSARGGAFPSRLRIAAIATTAAVAVLAIASVVFWLLRDRSFSPKPTEILGGVDRAAVKISFRDGVYYVFCCFPCTHLDDRDPHARGNQFMAAAFLKSALAQELGVPQDKYLKIRRGKYSLQPFRQNDMLVYIYEIAAADCSILPVKP